MCDIFFSFNQSIRFFIKDLPISFTWKRFAWKLSSGNEHFWSFNDSCFKWNSSCSLKKCFLLFWKEKQKSHRFNCVLWLDFNRNDMFDCFFNCFIVSKLNEQDVYINCFKWNDFDFAPCLNFKLNLWSSARCTLGHSKLFHNKFHWIYWTSNQNRHIDDSLQHNISQNVTHKQNCFIFKLGMHYFINNRLYNIFQKRWHSCKP